jgi:hypothetical protein
MARPLFRIIDEVDNLTISTADCVGFVETAVFDEDWEMLWCYRTKNYTQALKTHNYVMWCLLVTGELPKTL